MQANETNTDRLAPYRAAFHAGYVAFLVGSECVPPESADPGITDNYKDGWHEARSDRAQHIAGGFTPRD